MGSIMKMDFEGLNWIGHSVSTVAILGTLAGLLPPIAALAAFLWYSVQLYESRTVRHYFAHRRAKKIASLKARLKVLEEIHHEDDKR